MKFHFLNKDDKVTNTGLVVVIDVIRAFTTSAYAFNQGAEKIILVKTKEEAFSLQKQNPQYLLMGEEDGIKINGFNFSNSPYEISTHNLSGKTVVQRTSNGTAGVCNNIHCQNILAGSFIVVEKIIEYIKENSFEDINFIITNNFRSSEDAELATYICEQVLGHNNINTQAYLDVVRQARHAYKEEVLHEKDMQYVLDINKLHFNMKVHMQNQLPVLLKLN